MKKRLQRASRITVNENRGHRGHRRLWALALWSIVGLAGCHAPLKPDETAAQTPHQVFRLTTITAQRGEAILSDLGLGESSPAPEPNSLLVRGSAEDLQRAGIVLALVDTNEPCMIQRLAPAAEVRTLPSNNVIAESIGDIAIGTFSKPPEPGGSARVIIDIHADSVWSIAPARLWPDIRTVVESGGKAVRQDRDASPGSSRSPRVPHFLRERSRRALL